MENLHIEEIEDFVTSPPSYLVRYGVSILLLILCALTYLSWVIKSPDIVKASFKITSTHSPKVISPKVEGRLTHLFVKNGDIVKAGQILGYMESAAYPSEILQLIEDCNQLYTKMSNNDLNAISHFNKKSYKHLGEVQHSFQTFEEARIQFDYYLSSGIYPKYRQLLENDLINLKSLSKNFEEQLEIQKQDLSLSQYDFDIQVALEKDKVIAPLELKKEESKLLNKKMPIKSLQNSIVQNYSNQIAKEEEIIELDRKYYDQKVKFFQSLKTLNSELVLWYNKYIITSSTPGRISFPIAVQQNQIVKLNQEIAFIIPENPSYIGEMRVPQSNLGKVSIGQKVFIKLAGYPYEEFGALLGTVTSLSDISYKDSVFVAHVDITNNYRTTYNKSLKLREGMQATADIVTNDIRLLSKIFMKFKNI